MTDLLSGIRDAWFVACSARALGSRPRAVTVHGVPLAVFRGERGPGALEDVCPHRGAPLSRGRVRDGWLACPYHGWRFDRAGACREIPGRIGAPPPAGCAARAWRAVEADGWIWVTAGDAPSPPRLRHVDGYTHWQLGCDFVGRFIDVIENFLDPLHTHFVHPGLVRRDGRRREVIAVVRAIEGGVEADYHGEAQQQGLIGRLFGGGVTSAVGRFLLPSIVELEYRRGDQVALHLRGHLTPERSDRHRGHVTVSAAGTGPHMHLLFAGMYPLLWLALRQDRRILRLQHESRLRSPHARQISTDLDLLGGDVIRLLRGRPPRAVERSVRLLL